MEPLPMPTLHLPSGAWRPILEPIGAGSGVYAIRIVAVRTRKPWRISRFLERDADGILSIGQSGRLERRRKDFICGVVRGYGHAEGNLLHLVARHGLQVNAFGVDPLAQVEWAFEYRDHADAKAREEQLIKQYVRRFGEPPPLNSAIPGRYGGWPS